MSVDQKEAPKKEGAHAPAAEKKESGQREPLFEGIRIGISGRARGPNGAYLESRGGGKRLPSVVFSEGCLEVGGKSINVSGEGARIGERGQKSARIFVFDPEGEKGDAGLDLLLGEEGSCFIGETQCRVSLTRSLERETGPEDDTDPVYVVPQKLISGEEEVWDGIRFRTLARGESMKLEGNYSLRHLWESSGEDARLEILDGEGGRVAKFDCVEGDSFKIELAGVERKHMLRIVEMREATGAMDVLLFPKKEETEGK